MSKKMRMILTEHDLENALNQDYQDTINELVECTDLMLKGNKMLVENQLSEQEHQVLQEGLWEKVKFGLSKLGRYKAGGKIFGKGKIDQESAAKIQQILDKKGNEVIKKINDQIKSENPDFPNNEKGEEFLKTVMSIAAVYDSIVEATKKKPEEEGYLPTDAANVVIADLAEYVKKFLDVDLKGIYTVMDSEEDKIDSGEELLTDEVEDIQEDEAADIRAKLQAKGGDTKYDTKRMGKKGLKSNKLPMTLAGVGASLGAFSWLVNTDWFKSLFETVTHTPTTEFVTQTVETKAEIFGQIQPGQGMTQLMNEMNGLGLNPQSSPEDFLNGVKQLGGGDLQSGIDALSAKGGIFADPDQAKAVLTDIAGNPHGHGDNLGEIFQDKWAGTGESVGDALVTVPGGTLKGLIVKTIVTAVPKIIMKTSIKVGAGYAIAKGLGAALGPIGVGLVAAGALVKLMRMKGLKQSRSKTLNDLLQSLQPVKAEEASLPPVLPEPPNPATEQGGVKKNVCNAKNLNEINGLLNKIKTDSQNLAIFTDYMKDEEFRNIFFSAIADVNQSIKINKQPLVRTLADLRSQGLIEAPTGRQRKYLKFKLEFQNFMNDVFKLFVMLSKNCKDSQTYGVIKEFYKQLYIIATQGKNAGVKSRVKFESVLTDDSLLIEDANKDLRDKLFRKLSGNFSTFLKALNKLKPMEKGKSGKPSEEEIVKRREAKKGKGGEKGTEGIFGGSAPRTKPPQLAHHDRGESYLIEEIGRIKRLMK